MFPEGVIATDRVVADRPAGIRPTGRLRQLRTSVETEPRCETGLLRKPYIQQAVTAAQKERAARLGITADQVIQELAAIAFAKITDVVSWKDNKVSIVDSHKLDDHYKPIAEITQTESGTLRVKMHDKLFALDKLMKHLGMYDAHRMSIDHASSDGSTTVPDVIRLIGVDPEGNLIGQDGNRTDEDGNLIDEAA